MILFKSQLWQLQVGLAQTSACVPATQVKSKLSPESLVFVFMFLFQYEEYFTSPNTLNKYGMEGNISTQGLQAKTYSPIYLTLKFFHLETLIKNELNRVRFGINKLFCFKYRCREIARQHYLKDQLVPPVY